MLSAVADLTAVPRPLTPQPCLPFTPPLEPSGQLGRVPNPLSLGPNQPPAPLLDPLPLGVCQHRWPAAGTSQGCVRAALGGDEVPLQPLHTPVPTLAECLYPYRWGLPTPC